MSGPIVHDSFSIQASVAQPLWSLAARAFAHDLSLLARRDSFLMNEGEEESREVDPAFCLMLLKTRIVVYYGLEDTLNPCLTANRHDVCTMQQSRSLLDVAAFLSRRDEEHRGNFCPHWSFSTAAGVASEVLSLLSPWGRRYLFVWRTQKVSDAYLLLRTTPISGCCCVIS